MEEHALTLDLMSLNASVLRATLDHVANKVKNVFSVCFDNALIDAVASRLHFTITVPLAIH